MPDGDARKDVVAEDGTHRVTLRLIHVSRTNKVPVLISCRQIDRSIDRFEDVCLSRLSDVARFDTRFTSYTYIYIQRERKRERARTAHTLPRSPFSPLRANARRRRSLYLANLLFINDGSMSRRKFGDARRSVFNTLFAILIRYLGPSRERERPRIPPRVLLARSEPASSSALKLKPRARTRARHEETRSTRIFSIFGDDRNSLRAHGHARS